MPQSSRNGNREISRKWERGWWQGSEGTQQRSQSSQGTGTEQWPKYKTDTVRCRENCLGDQHNSFLSTNPQIIPACMCISMLGNMPVLLLLHPLQAPEPTWAFQYMEGPGKKHDGLLGLLRASMRVETTLNQKRGAAKEPTGIWCIIPKEAEQWIMRQCCVTEYLSSKSESRLRIARSSLTLPQSKE